MAEKALRETGKQYRIDGKVGVCDCDRSVESSEMPLTKFF